jgi:2-iminobutanoate/2-iminopropanoate deaminase
MEIVHTNEAPRAIGPYSQAIVAEGFVFTAGQIALDPASGEVVATDIVGQTEQVLRNLASVLEEAGSRMAKVVKTTVYLADMAEFSAMNEVYARHFGDHKPARSTVQVAGLPKNVRVEIDVVAVRG